MSLDEYLALRNDQARAVAETTCAEIETPEATAECLYASWVARDYQLALTVATPEVADYMFGSHPDDPGYFRDSELSACDRERGRFSCAFMHGNTPDVFMSVDEEGGRYHVRGAFFAGTD